MTPDEFIVLVYKNLKGEISEQEFLLLNETTISDSEMAKVRMETEDIWDQTGNLPALVTSTQTSQLFDNLTSASKDNLRKTRTINLRRILSSVAAIFLLGIAVIWLMKPKTEFYDEPGTYTLNDGSTIELREKSSLTVPPFSGNERAVSLQGEAYFDITKDQEKPFVVASKNIEVRVLGTKFLVKEAEMSTYVKLDEGNIKTTDRRSKESLILTPGMIVKHDSEGLISEEEGMQNLNSWQSGVLEYDNVNLEKVLKELETVFDSKISVSDQTMLNCKLSGIISGKKVEEILDTITNRYEMSMENNGKNWILRGGKCK